MIYPDPKKHTIRLKGKAMEQLRRECYIRDTGICKSCGNPTSWERGHMAHIRSRGAGGEDILSNVLWKCMECHLGLEHGKGVK